eukprot:3448799-Rhodomonas_salina.1
MRSAKRSACSGRQGCKEHPNLKQDSDSAGPALESARQALSSRCLRCHFDLEPGRVSFQDNMRRRVSEDGTAGMWSRARWSRACGHGHVVTGMWSRAC